MVFKVLFHSNSGRNSSDKVNKRGSTCGKVLIDWPVVHLQSGIAPVPGESDQMVFAIVHCCGCLLNTDVHCPNVECHTYFALFLKKTQREGQRKELMF